MSVEALELDIPLKEYLKKDPIIQAVDWRVLRGCNVYHTASVVRLVLGINTDLTATSVELGAEFTERFIGRFLHLPSMIPDFGHADALESRLRSGGRVTVTNLLIEAILAMEAAMSSEARLMEVVEFAQVVEEEEPNRLAFIWSSNAPRFSRDLADIALLGASELLNEAIRNAKNRSSFNFDKAFEGLRKRARQRRLAASNTILIQAARERNIPAVRTGTSHVRLGEGRYQTVIRSASTATTSYAATRLSINKRLTNRRLWELRLPVPKQLRATTPESAIVAAETVGFPVVVKPIKGSRGAGVTVGAKMPDQVRQAFHVASYKRPDVVVEQFLPGDDHRLLVVGDRCIAGVKRIPPSVTGDGKQTIAALVERLNTDPFRDNFRMFQVKIDDELKLYLSGHGYKPDDVLEHGVELPLRSVSNVSKGGIPIDVSDEIHPLNRVVAVRAAQGIGLDVAGVDIVTTDISKPYTESNGCIIEVNARPGLDLHRFPRHGKPRDVGGAILDLVYPEATTARVRKAMVIGDRRTAAVARDVEAFIRGAGQVAGLTIRNSAFVNGGRQTLVKRQHHTAARQLLRDPDIETLIVTASPKDIIARGLQFMKTDIIALMPLAEKTDLNDYKAAIAVALSSKPVLVVVDDNNSQALAELSSVPCKQIALVSQRGETPRMREHLEAGGHGVFVELHDGQRVIVLKQGDDVTAKIPVTVSRQIATVQAKDPEQGVELTGRRSRRINVRVFASVMAHALGLDPEEIARAIANSPALAK